MDKFELAKRVAKEFGYSEEAFESAVAEGDTFEFTLKARAQISCEFLLADPVLAAAVITSGVMTGVQNKTQEKRDSVSRIFRELMD
jgi:hypothetical protein